MNFGFLFFFKDNFTYIIEYVSMYFTVLMNYHTGNACLVYILQKCNLDTRMSDFNYNIANSSLNLNCIIITFKL